MALAVIFANPVNRHYSFRGKMSSKKNELRAEVQMVTGLYGARGGVITVCKPGVAYGAEFSRNQRPRLR